MWEVHFFVSGIPEQALARSSAAIAEARRLAHPPSLAVSLSIGNRLLSLVGDHSAMDALADDLITVAAEQSFTFWSAQGTIYRGYARVRSGDVPEGISLLRSGSTRPGRNCGCPITSPSWPRHVRSPSKPKKP
jgi:hypothetical protein